MKETYLDGRLRLRWFLVEAISLQMSEKSSIQFLVVVQSNGPLADRSLSDLWNISCRGRTWEADHTLMKQNTEVNLKVSIVHASS